MAIVKPVKLSVLKQVGMRILMLGVSGTGKTTSIAQLVEAGYNVKFVDIEGITLYLQEALEQRGILDPDNLSIFHIETETQPEVVKTDDKTSATIKAEERTLQTVKDTLQHLVETSKVGDVIVLDSISQYLESLERFAMPGGENIPSLSGGSWSLMLRYINDLLLLLTSPAMKAHVIVIGHLTEKVDKDKFLGFRIMAPMDSIRKKLYSHFTHVVQTDRVSAARVNLKLKGALWGGSLRSSAKYPEEFALNNGLLKMFDILEHVPPVPEGGKKQKDLIVALEPKKAVFKQ